jgi:D-alanyl-D-alanine carboxypeptidase
LASQRANGFSRHPVTVAIAAALLALACFMPSVAAAKGNAAHGIENLRKYAAIVVDAKSGNVLYEANADETRYPASITKVMTLYILFQELSAGHIKLNSLLTVSPYAASASPTKLGLRAGSKIKVEDAIKSIVTISANDMARTIAENISGSEAAFARRMTATAHAMGMRHTTYVNASGLPDGRQRTTVRDQAILASAVYEHFPQYYDYFQTQSFAYGRRVYRSHDNVLGFMGVDGLKTGYINAAGYNLMTASRADGRHLIVIGFGFNSGAARDAKVRSLVRTYLPKARSGKYLASAMIQMPGRQQKPAVMLANAEVAPVAAPSIANSGLVLPLPSPDFRQEEPAVAEAVAYAPEPMAYPDALTPGQADSTALAPPMDIGARPAVAALSAIGEPTSARARGPKPDIVGQSLNDMLLGAPPAPLGATRASAPLVPPVGIGAQNEPIDLMTSGGIKNQQVAEAVFTTTPQQESDAPDQTVAMVAPAPAAAAPAPSGWIVQIGSAPSQEGAKRLLATATGKIATLNDLRPYVERFDKNGQTFYRARFVGFGDEDQASGMCRQLKKAKMSCLAMQG